MFESVANVGLQGVRDWMKLKLLVKQLFCGFVEIICGVGVDGCLGSA